MLDINLIIKKRKYMSSLFTYIYNIQKTIYFNSSRNSSWSHMLFFKANYLAVKSLTILIEISVFPHLWLFTSTSLVHMRRLLWIHDNVDGNGKWKAIHHVCDLLLGNAVFIPPGGQADTVVVLGCKFLKVCIVYI